MQKPQKITNKQEGLSNQTKINILNLCRQTYIEICSKKEYKSSKTFFTSYANKFIQQLIHFHSQTINKLLRTMIKQHSSSIDEKQSLLNVSPQMEKIVQQQWKIYSQQNIIKIINKIVYYLLSKQSILKSKAQRQNMYLQIQCSLNYTCPVCLSKKNINDIKSQNCIDQSSIKNIEYQPILNTTKQISYQGKMKQNKKVVPLTPLEKIFQKMNDARRSLKLIQDNRKAFSNKQWGLFGKLLDLNRQQFLYTTIELPKNGSKKELFEELNQINATNKNYISKFRRQMYLKGIKSHKDIQNIDISNYQTKKQSKAKSEINKTGKNIRLSIKKKLTCIEDVSKRQSISEMKRAIRCKEPIQQKTQFNTSLNRIRIKCIDFGTNCMQNLKTDKVVVNDRSIKTNIRLEIYKKLVMKSHKLI